MTEDSTPPAKPSARYRRTSATWPCIFASALAVQRLDPAVKRIWEATRGDGPKWGDLRTVFRREHCQLVNPYGSETCPFAESECALAFYRAVEASLTARNPYGYFRSVARSSGAERADLAQGARARMRTHGSHQGAVERAAMGGLREGSPAGVRTPPEERVGRGVRDVEEGPPVEGVRRNFSRPDSIGTLLGSLDLRPREGPAEDRRSDPEAPRPEQEGPR